MSLHVVVNMNAGGNLNVFWWLCASTKVSSRCSTDKLVRAPFLNHCALNNDERVAILRSPFTNANSRARTPALMLAAAANATATPAPASHHGFTMPTDGWPFAVSARDSDAIGSRTISLQDNHSGSP